MDPSDDPNPKVKLKPNYITIKNSLRAILKKGNEKSLENHIDIIKGLAYRTNIIVQHMLMFFKLYMIKWIDDRPDFPFDDKTNPIANVDFPKVDKKFFTKIFNVITKKDDNTKGRQPVIDPIFQEFFNVHFKPLMRDEDIISRNRLTQIILYEIDQILTNLKNNINMHYPKHLRKVISVLFGFENEIRRIKSQRLSKSEKRYQLRVINTDISNFYHDLIQFYRPELWKSRDEIKNNPQFYGLLGYLRTVFIPPGMNFNETRDFHYHITRNLKLYIPRMFLLCRELERYNDKLNPENYKIPLFNVCPLRRSCIPKYITIDTQTLFNLFLGKEPPNRNQINDVKNGWKQIFNIDLRCFTSKEIRPNRTERLKKGYGYTFNYLIKTDGISGSISLVKTDIHGKPVTTDNNVDNEDDDNDNEEFNDPVPKDVPYITEPMFDRFNDITRVVVIDPGKIDLINASRIGYVLDYAAIR
jgi:hypothetical protein